MQNNEPSLTSMRQMVLRFLASFSLENDVTDAILQNKEKMKVQYLRDLWFICLKFCRLLELSKRISLDLKFRCYGNQNQNDCLLLKKQKVYYLEQGVSKNNLKQYSFYYYCRLSLF